MVLTTDGPIESNHRRESLLITESQQDDIIIQNLDLVFRYVNHFSKSGLKHFRDDMISIGVYELVYRVRQMESEHPNVEAFIIKCVKSRLLDFLRREKIRSHLPFDEALVGRSVSDTALDEELDGLKLTHMKRQIVWYMLQGYKQYEIADLLGVGTATVSRQITEIRSQINERQES